MTAGRNWIQGEMMAERLLISGGKKSFDEPPMSNDKSCYR